MRACGLITCAWVVMTLGCGDDGSEDGRVAGNGGASGTDSGGHGGATAGSSASTGHGGDSAGAGAGSGSQAPGSPVLTDASLVIHGTMSLTWTLPDSGCDQVEINRNQDGGDYAVAQTLTGEATSAEDAPGHENGTFCYTITCMLDDQSSSPSNEKCVTQ